jgi:hypothetical protein
MVIGREGSERAKEKTDGSEIEIENDMAEGVWAIWIPGFGA